MASPVRVRELRYLSGTTFNTTFTAADDAAWAAGTAVKLRPISFDASGLDYSSEADPTLESQLYRGRPNIPLIRTGGIKFGLFLEGAQSDTAANPVATLLSKILGGIQGPASSRTANAVTSGGSTTVLASTGIGAKVYPGQAVLCGLRSEARGHGEVRVIASEATDSVTFAMAIQGAMTETLPDVGVISTTVYFDPGADQSYLDFLAIGHSAEDQLQVIGAMGGFELADLGPGKVPKINFDLRCGDWQEVASGDRDQLEPTSAASGNAPAGSRGLGGFFLQDNGTTTRAVYKCADFSCSPGIAYEPVPDFNGVNGLGGWQKVVSVPTWEATLLLEGSTDPLPGFYEDFVAGTAKQLLVQFGHAAQGTVAIDFPKCYFDGPPIRTDAGGLTAVKVKGHGEMVAYSRSAATDSLAVSPMRIHFM